MASPLFKGLARYINQSISQKDAQASQPPGVGWRHVVLEDLYFNAAKLKHSLEEEDEYLKKATREVLAVADCIGEDHRLYHKVEILRKKLPQELLDNPRFMSRVQSEYASASSEPAASSSAYEPLNPDEINSRYCFFLCMFFLCMFFLFFIFYFFC